MPGLAHWFGLTWETHLQSMPLAEIEVYVKALGTLPPPGGVIVYTRSD